MTAAELATAMAHQGAADFAAGPVPDLDLQLRIVPDQWCYRCGTTHTPDTCAIGDHIHPIDPCTWLWKLVYRGFTYELGWDEIPAPLADRLTARLTLGVQTWTERTEAAA